MTGPNTFAGEQRLRSVSEAVSIAFRHVATEKRALTMDAKRASSKERERTLNRMGQTLFEAAQELRTTLLRLGSLYGLQALDLNGLAAQDDTGTGPYWMIMMPELDEDLLDAADSLDTAVQKLAETYSPTRKHPDLAVARHPDHMQMVFNALRMATTVLTAELAVHGYHKGAENLRDTFSPAAMF